MRLIDITGEVFGRLTVLHKGPPRPSGGSDWVCRCACGTVFTAIGSNIRKGDTRSCGCLAVEHASAMGANLEFIAKRAEKIIKHGHARRSGDSPEYAVWLGMKSRCSNPTDKDYPAWGGRDIAVCERWRTSFDAFLSDMGPRPSVEHSIDRFPDNDGNYEPGNCRWATKLEQGEARRDLLPVTVDGVLYPSRAAACRVYGVSQTVAHARIASGIDPATAVSTAERMKPRRSRESYLPKSRR